ncbi:MAG: GntR family transcriptional regulator [Actinomycetota bacterium]
MSTVKRPGTAVDDLVENLRERIVTGALAPGVRLSQQQLAEDLQVSRTPLREALQRLATEGLVMGQANRGMVVAPAPLSHVEDAYALRLLVEPATVAAIVETVTDDDIAAMEKALLGMERAGVSTRDFQNAHAAYHEVMLQRYPPYASELIHALHMRIYRQQRLYFSRPPAVADFIWLDRIFLQAVAERKGQLARHLLEFHLLDAAVGLVVEIDPDYHFQALGVSLHGIGMEVPNLGTSPIARPLEVTWQREVPMELPDLKTGNLSFVPAP